MGSGCGRCGAEERDAFICRVCTAELDRAIGDMTSLLHEVSVLATGQTNVYRSTAPRLGPDEELADLEEEYGHRQRRIPAWLRSRDGRITLPCTPEMVNLAARDLLDDAFDTLMTWACTVGADEISSKNVVPWLLCHINDVRFHEDAAQMHDEITYLHRRMMSAVDRSQQRVYAGPCENEECRQPNVDGQLVPTDLYAPWAPAGVDVEHAQEQNEKEFTCDGHRTNGIGCGQAYTWASRRPWLIDTIKTSMVTVDDLLAALPELFPDLVVPPRMSVNGWIRDGRLPTHSSNYVGESLHPGARFLELIEKYKPKTYAPRRRREVA
jgi:hypothetical protein